MIVLPRCWAGVLVSEGEGHNNQHEVEGRRGGDRDKGGRRSGG